MTSNVSSDQSLPNARTGGVDHRVDARVDLQGPLPPPPGGLFGWTINRPRWFSMIPFAIVAYLMVITRSGHSPIVLVLGCGLLLAGSVVAFWVTFTEASQRDTIIALIIEPVAALLLTLIWPGSLGWIIIIWAASRAGSRLPTHLAAGYLIVIEVLFLAVSYRIIHGQPSWSGDIIWPLLVFIMVFVIGTQRSRQQQYVRQIEHMVVELRTYSAELEEVHRRLQAEALQAAALAAAEERNRIAQEIHDVLAHSLTIIVVQAQAIKKVVRTDPKAAEAQSDAIAQLARDGLQEARRSVAAMRTEPVVVDGLGTLRNLVEGFGASTGTQTHFEVLGDKPGISPSTWATLFRVAQEALTNARRHGQAQQIEVALMLDGNVKLFVRDDGVSRLNASVVPGNGLTGMRERAERLNGTLKYGPRAVGGFEVELELPG